MFQLLPVVSVRRELGATEEQHEQPAGQRAGVVRGRAAALQPRTVPLHLLAQQQLHQPRPEGQHQGRLSTQCQGRRRLVRTHWRSCRLQLRHVIAFRIFTMCIM